ncbi:dUTP diphosphatase [Fusobacterium polymorphum]|jgi:putative uncharacterized protein FNV2273|uniref:dUTP diphosphatase n=1 Tax=Fusobacterium nucleatum subsp. polymorphum TaxID=76857 RepID=UPI002058200E|nr:MAG TPA: dUTPase [Caudoviricetes sp.]
MRIRAPKNFEDILELQGILDERMNNTRERTEEDIKLSLIAELIELNEETKYSHKTWKTKEYNREKELEELTDVYFFFARLINYRNRDGRFEIEYYCREFELFPNYYAGSYFTRLIYNLLDNSFRWFFGGLLTCSAKLGYTKEDILKTYWNKWQKNMQRIGKEWN